MATKGEVPSVNSFNIIPPKCNVNDLCRLCLSATDNRLEIFGKVGQITNISDIICILFSSQVLQNDHWPQSICISCFQKLTEFHAFYSTVKATEATLVGLCGEWSPPESNNAEEEVKFCPSVENTDAFKEQTAQSSGNLINFLNDYPEVKQEVFVDVLETEDQEVFQESTEDDKEREEVSTVKSHVEIKKRTRATPSKKKKARETTKNTRVTNSDIAKYIKITCDLCSENFWDFEELKQHFSEKHKQDGYVKCCDLTIKTRGALVQHAHYHKDPSKYKCHDCGRFFKSRARLSEHRDTHIPEEEKQFKCDQCPMKFAKPGRLKYHRMIHIPKEKWEHSCQQCTKTFPTVYLMRSHIKLMHERSQRRVCEICAKVCNSNQSFLVHQRTHMDIVATIECEQCGKMFKDRSNMVRHMRLHRASVGVFPCDICAKEFQTKRRMQSHRRHVHSQKSFKCNLCEKEFKHSMNLKEHVATHTGQQLLYQCIFCEKKFNSNANKYVHQKRNHPDEWEEERKKKLEKTT